MIAFSRAWIWGAMAFVVIGTSSCGPEVIVMPRGDGGTGGAGVTSSSSASSSTGAGGSSVCVLDDVSTWDYEVYNIGGDHPRFAAATSGVPWVALAVQGGNVVLEKLGVDEQGIVVLDKFEIPDSPVYPLAFDANDERFVLLSTTGNNWNGILEIWLVDRASGSVMRQTMGNPDDPGYTSRAALGLVDDGVVVAYSQSDNLDGVVEIRNGNLEVVTSQVVNAGIFSGVWRSPKAFDIYLDGTSRAHVEGGVIKVQYITPDSYIMGGLGEFLVDAWDEFRLTNGKTAWVGPWPDTQISPPYVVRTYGDIAVVALETELSGVVGYPKAGALEWLRVESMPDAWGVGVALLPVIEERRLGLFYVGLEIPDPEQPLRYFGRVCH